MPVHSAVLTYFEWFTGILLFVCGVSHMVQPRLWSQLFVELLQKPYAGLFIGALALPLGLAIALGHNVWGWHLSVIVTIVGWGWTIKGTLYLIYPGLLQKVGTRNVQYPQHFVIAGAVVAILGLIVILDRLFMTG